MIDKGFHPRLIAQDAAPRESARWINRKNSDFPSKIGEVRTKGFNKGAFSHSGYSGYTYSNGLVCMWKTFLYQPACLVLILLSAAFN